MDQRIYLKELDCYQRASEKQKAYKRARPDYYFDLAALPTEELREECRSYILERSRHLTLTSMAGERQAFGVLCRFIQEKNPTLPSFLAVDESELKQALNVWLYQHDYKTKSVRKRRGTDHTYIKSSNVFILIRTIRKFLTPEDTTPEREKDIWNLDYLGIPISRNPIVNTLTLNFSKISQPGIKKEVQDACFLLLQGLAVRTVTGTVSSVNRFSKYLKKYQPEVQSLAHITRIIVEGYLMYLNTEDHSRKDYHSELHHLKTLFTEVGKLLEKPELGQLFIYDDMPRVPKRIFDFYSDEELMRLNSKIVKLNEQLARALIIHQMLGTRISDTLTLRTDCLYLKEETFVVRIYQVKTSYYEKPVSDEVAALIQKAIQYTKRTYGETTYIFIDHNRPPEVMKYSYLQYHLTVMIKEYDLRDDKGELFTVGTHLFRHTYGKKLTEMHVEDLVIAKLLGHANISNVQHYRRMGDLLLAKETKKVRGELDEELRTMVKGWEENEYKQIR